MVREGVREEFLARVEIATDKRKSKNAASALIKYIVGCLKDNTDGAFVEATPVCISRCGSRSMRMETKELGVLEAFTTTAGIVCDREVKGGEKKRYMLVSIGHPFTVLSKTEEVAKIIQSGRLPSPLVLRDQKLVLVAQALQELLVASLDKKIVEILELNKIVSVYLERDRYDLALNFVAQQCICRFRELPEQLKLHASPCMTSVALEGELYTLCSCYRSFDFMGYQNIGNIVLKYLSTLTLSQIEAISSDWAALVKKCWKISIKEVFTSNDSPELLYPTPERIKLEELLTAECVEASAMINSFESKKQLPGRRSDSDVAVPISPRRTRIKEELHQKKDGDDRLTNHDRVGGSSSSSSNGIKNAAPTPPSGHTSSSSSSNGIKNGTPTTPPSHHPQVVNNRSPPLKISVDPLHRLLNIRRGGKPWEQNNNTTNHGGTSGNTPSASSSSTQHRPPQLGQISPSVHPQKHQELARPRAEDRPEEQGQAVGSTQTCRSTRGKDGAAPGRIEISLLSDDDTDKGEEESPNNKRERLKAQVVRGLTGPCRPARRASSLEGEEEEKEEEDECVMGDVKRMKSAWSKRPVPPPPAPVLGDAHQLLEDIERRKREMALRDIRAEKRQRLRLLQEAGKAARPKCN